MVMKSCLLSIAGKAMRWSMVGCTRLVLSWAQALAQERGIAEPADMLRALLPDAVEIYDAMWDKTFAETQDVLEILADEAHAEYVVGLTEDFDLDKFP